MAAQSASFINQGIMDMICCHMPYFLSRGILQSLSSDFDLPRAVGRIDASIQV